MILEAEINEIRLKSIKLSSYLLYLTNCFLKPLGITVGSPEEPEKRGSHVSLQHPEGYRISRALIEEMNVLPDFREPDNIRLGLSPLYTSYRDVRRTVSRIQQVITEGTYKKYSRERSGVT